MTSVESTTSPDADLIRGRSTMGTTAQLEFTAEELLADPPVSAPLIAGGVRCHGGFDDDGNYVSPRTRIRVPAIEAWQAQHTQLFGTAQIDTPMETWGGHYPNVDQARFLIGAGVPEPLAGTTPPNQMALLEAHRPHHVHSERTVHPP